MADAFLGEIRLFAGKFAPKNWAFAEGQLLPLSQNAALFSILGTTYGGNGKSTFALPDLRGAVPMGVGQGPNTSMRYLGETAGSATVTLTTDQLPYHTHPLVGTDDEANGVDPTNGSLAVNLDVPMYTAGDAGGLSLTAMHVNAVSPAGGGQPHNNMQPYLPLAFIICLAGLYPSRPTT